MSQRVNIQFSIDLDELPDEVERLIGKFGDEITTTTELYNELSEDVISVAGLQDINGLRLSLARADHILDDVNKIVTGYIRMNTQEHQEEQSTETGPQVNPFAPNADTFNNIEDKLRAFTERMSSEQPTESTDSQK
jgi:hypothetical protein|tara:strand:+ start:534 stop:941 length:408 start_codon:yes stop_codon:yes gene_type:complete